MSEPPPSPLLTTAEIRENDHTSNRPCRPSLGSQKFRAMSWGERAKEPGGYALPRSSRQTSRPASARRHAITEPPKPDPTTTTSKSDRSGRGDVVDMGASQLRGTAATRRAGPAAHGPA